MMGVWARIANADLRRFLLLLVTLAFVLRFGAVIALRGLEAGPSTRHGADGIEFDALARSMAAGTGYAIPPGKPTSFRAPGLPLFLAAIYATAGVNYPMAKISFCVLGSVGCLLTYLLARELVSDSLARAAGVLSAVYFPNIHSATVFASENLFVPMQALGLWLYILHIKDLPRGKRWALAAAGAVLGFSALVRPFALVLLPMMAAILATCSLRRWRAVVRDTAIFAATFLATVAPWTVRNYAVHERFVLVATNGGSTFYGGNNTLVSSEFRRLGSWISTTELPGRDLIDATPDEVAHDRMEWALGWHWLRDHQGKIPVLLAGKFFRMWLPDLDTPNRSMIAAQVACYTPFLFLFVVAGVRCLRDRRYWLPPWLALHGTLLATVLTCLVFWGCPRFRDANMPLLMVYSVLAFPVSCNGQVVAFVSRTE
jgi:4-amino-4-deoxy-L-arabinose transferase-like glycosyltransferase